MSKVKVIRFHTQWCGPCKVYAPIFEEVSKDEKYSEVEFSSIDAEQQPDIAQELNVSAVPTTVIIKDDKVVASYKKVMIKTELESVISEQLL